MIIREFAWIPSIATIIITFLIMGGAGVIYHLKMRKIKGEDVPKGFCLVVEMFVRWCQTTVEEVGGEKMKKTAPYFAFLIIYISCNNLIALIGFETPIAEITMPLALGSFTFLGIFFFAIKYRNREFAKEYINPTTWLTQFSPLISITFRIFGNIISGVIVIGLLYSVTDLLWRNIPVIGQVNLLGGFFLPPFHFYFDIFEGILQSYVFAMLTVSYWGKVANTDEEETKKVKKVKANKEPNKRLNLFTRNKELK